jgi:PadR family transcriptional regulator, regulatory protein PadR
VPTPSADLEFKRGAIELLLLKTLSWGPMHGFEITSWLEQRSNGRLDVTDAALIQALHRLEARGLLSAEWGESKNGRKARYYKLTSSGKSHLRAESAALIDYVNALTTVLATRSAND